MPSISVKRRPRIILDQTLRSHVDRVKENIQIFVLDLQLRSLFHDMTKLDPQERLVFDLFPDRLPYGTPAYFDRLVQLSPALTHHYENNTHHPEHYPNGILGFDLFDLIEAMCDWEAAHVTTLDGSFRDSLRITTERFGIESQLFTILHNTSERLLWYEKDDDVST